MLLLDKIADLESQIEFLTSKIEDLTKKVDTKPLPPKTFAGGFDRIGLIAPVDVTAGYGLISGNAVLWNNGELGTPPINEEIPLIWTTKGYNKHTHSRYSGGALIKQNLEIVEYDPTDWALIVNPHSQQFWQTDPQIKKSLNSKNESVDTIGLLDLTFNPDTLKWGTTAYEIDVRKCFFVERDADGVIVLDANGKEKKSPLFNTDQTKTSIQWDEDSQVWRLYAAYAPGTPTGV